MKSMKIDMKKILAILVLFCVMISCEKDDFCTQNPVTPKLVLRFYDNFDRTKLKTVNQLYVWAAGKDSIFVNQSTDSISIPLNAISNETVYNFSKGNIVNQITIRYTPQQIYVSRSCGFKVNFEEISYISNNTWISDFEVKTTTINSQNAAHVQIFH